LRTPPMRAGASSPPHDLSARVKDEHSPYFSVESSRGTRFFYYFILAGTLIFSAAAALAPLTTPFCNAPDLRRRLGQGLEGGLEDAPNPQYHPDPCRWVRYAALLGMNKWEAQMTRRVLVSLLLGSIIGFERRRADRPAGIRTMAMVCLGACVFTIGSIFAFFDGTMGWDSSRVSAAIPSGVGFLGAASIWKGTKTAGASGETVPEVHGLTTATSVWLSAAIGILCGGGLYVPAGFTTAAGVVYLRFAPRLSQPQEEADDEESGEGGEKPSGAAPKTYIPASSSMTGSIAQQLKEPLRPNDAAGVGASAPLREASRDNSIRSPRPKSNSCCSRDAASIFA